MRRVFLASLVAQVAAGLMAAAGDDTFPVVSVAKRKSGPFVEGH